MKKYRFIDEFATGLIVKDDATVSILLDGKKVECKAPILGDISIEGIPCLVRTDSGKKITVEAVSDGISDTGRRSWICLRPMLYEEAFGFFLEQYMREKPIREYKAVRRCSDSEHMKCDFIVGDVAIDIKAIVPVITAHKGNIQTKLSVLLLSADYFKKSFARLTTVKDIAKRKILMLICSYGTKGEISDYCGEEIIESAKEKGVEIWLAEMLCDADGIELVSCQNIEDCHALIP